MANARTTIWVIAVVLSVATSPVLAMVHFRDGGTHNIDYVIDDDVWVDWGGLGMQTTVNLLSGGSINYPWSLVGCESSQINILGGSIGWCLWAFDSSQVDISGGSMEHVSAHGGSQVHMGAGSVRSLFYASDSSQVDFSGGSIGDYLSAWGSSQVYISGGSIQEYVYALDSSHVEISGGAIGYLYTRDNSQMHIFGGSIGGGVETGYTSRVEIFGGSIGDFVWGHQSSQVEIFGGSIGGELFSIDWAVLTVHGSNFAVDGQPCGYGELTSIFGGHWGAEPSRHLTGTLASGEPIDNDFYIGNDAKIVLVPEAGSIETTVDIDPDTFNLKSKVPWIICYIELPEGYNVGDIDVSTIVLNDVVPAESRPTEIGDYDSDGIADLMVKFDRSVVQEILDLGDEVEITVTGELTDGTPFEGSDTIRVIDKGGKK